MDKDSVNILKQGRQLLYLIAWKQALFHLLAILSSIQRYILVLVLYMCMKNTAF
jgi:hypothetical protein